ncbi:MAG: oxygenase MpaB family protein [Actinomycetota bacterium]
MSSATSRLVGAARPLHDRLRRRVAIALRDRVAGQDNAAKAALIWDAPGKRWFSDADPIWRVHADASMFVAGIRALLLQSLHPLAMAGVAGHSGYKGDPWGRLQRTSTFLATTTFGTIEDAEALIQRIRGIHERVRGRAPDGRPYAASDPHLLKWVHLAETDSFLRTHQRYGVTPLTAAEADRYVAQSCVVASRLGVINPPTTVRGLDAAIESYQPELTGTAQARDAARFLLLHPPLPWSARPGYGALAGAGVAMLPTWARRDLALPLLPLADRAIALPLGGAATSVIRWALRHPHEAHEQQR